MAAPKGEDELNRLFEEILFDISEHGNSWKKALEGKMSSATFNKLIDSDNEKLKCYMRACEQRADVIAEDTLNIADQFGDDTITMPDGNIVENARIIARDRLRVDTRKWLLSKLHPKKYGDKMVLGGDPENPLTAPVIQIDLSKYTTDELRTIDELQRKGRAGEA